MQLPVAQNQSTIQNKIQMLKVNISVTISDENNTFTIPLSLPEMNEPKAVEAALDGVKVVANLLLGGNIPPVQL